MSSAAVQQSTPQQYNQSSPVRDRYAANAISSSPPTSRYRSNSGNASYGSPPQQPQYASPSNSAAMSTPRGQTIPASSHVSPSEPMSNSTYQQFYPDAGAAGPPVALPVRTSSQQAPTSGATASAYDSRSSYSSRPQQASTGYGSESERERTRDNERRQQQQRSPEQPGSAGRGQRSRQQPTQSRSATAVGQTPVDTSLPRENSAIITHIVVDDPQADIAREKARVAEARPHQPGQEPGMVDQTVPADSQQKHRSRQEHLRQPGHRKEVKFGDYILGQTLGEGEFGKVKMGWKKDSSVQVAIKLIRKESLQSNTTRLPKIYREIGILRDLQHPNIVRLHEFVETERHMGIILEYASGGELFDYILNHRYLKDPAARRLFAQLVSGVGYLHKKGIVHRDLKLENLLLDRNRNIIITDFGFANTFDPNDELDDEVEKNITDKEFVKRRGLDKVNDKGGRRGDLMQTSCGSPCYAAPELVVSDGLYTGRKVDVWSCGVILYAMLAGYLPFDDDPANPEGDNINLLYKYIVSTPLTFPEYVTPHARDLLRRILVPDPRRRADLFEVARHSWLSEYSHVVGFIGSSTKSDRDIASSAMQQGEEPALGRSASVREPTSRSPASAGGAVQKAPPSSDADAEARNKSRDAKRRTVQLEYVPPKDTTARGEASPTGAAMPAIPTAGRTRARGDAPVEVPPTAQNRDVSRKDMAQAMPPPVRPARDQARATSDSPAAYGQPAISTSRPNTGGSLGAARLPSRGNSYSQPAVPASTAANAQGYVQQPKSSSGYIISGPMQQGGDQTPTDSRPGSQNNLAMYQQQTQPLPPEQQPPRGHKRSSTLGSIGDRILGRNSARRTSQQQEGSSPSPKVLEKRDRKYPPVSMRQAMPNSNDDAQPRASTESSRRTSFALLRKGNSNTSSNEVAGSNESKRSSRRFSLLPSSWSMNNFGSSGKKDSSQSGEAYRPESKGMAFGQGTSRSPSMSTTNSTIPLYYDADREAARQQRRSNAPPSSRDANANRYEKPLPQAPTSSGGYQSTSQSQGYPSNSAGYAGSAAGGHPTPPPVQRTRYRDDGYGGNLLDPSDSSTAVGSGSGPGYGSASGSGGPVTMQQEPVDRYFTPAENYENMPSSPAQQAQYQPNQSGHYSQYPPQSSGGYSAAHSQSQGYGQQGYGSGGQQGPNANLRGSNRKFEYEHGHSGSSSATRRVMDFFRRRGRDRSEG